MENLKSIKNILIDVDNNLCGAETAIEKGKFQSTQLYDDFSKQSGKLGRYCGIKKLKRIQK